MNSQILITITPDELAAMVAERVIAILNQQTAPASKDPTKYYSRKEIATHYHITLKTLNDWTKRGKVKGYRIGRRVLYKVEEVDKALQAIKTK